jgi:TPR repeat protein
VPVTQLNGRPARAIVRFNRILNLRCSRQGASCQSAAEPSLNPFFRAPGAAWDSEARGVSLFRKRQPTPAAAPVVFDGIAGRDVLARSIDDFLESLANGAIDAALAITQRIFQAMPGDPTARVSETFFDDRWKWIAAVSQRAWDDRSLELAAKIGLFCQVWHRILEQDPRLQFGRLTQAPPEYQIPIYTVSLRALHRLGSAATLVPGPDGWTVGSATEQIAIAVRRLRDAGESIPEELSLLVAGDPAVIDESMGGSTNAAGAAADAILDQAKHDMESGDEAQRLYVAAAFAAGDGDLQRAFEMLERSAQLGHVEAMTEAGLIAGRLGNPGASRFWTETSAKQGSPVGMFNFAVLESEAGRNAAAATWFQRAAEAGNTEGYAALTEMAERADDRASLERWAQLGAAAGHPHCLHRHGYLLYDAGDRTGGLAAMEQAAELGNGEAMVMAGLMCHELGNTSRARYWLLKAGGAGQQQAAELIVRLGLA